MSEEYAIPPADDLTDNDRVMAALSYPIPIFEIPVLTQFLQSQNWI